MSAPNLLAWLGCRAALCLRLNYSSQRLRDIFLFTGLLLLILGLRIFIGIRFVVPLPQPDDLRTLFWLQKWSGGIHDWGFIGARSNGHFFVLYYLTNLGQYLLNGYWDGRLDFLTYAFVHTAEAAVVLLTFGTLLTPRDRWWLFLLVFLLFAVPFGGYRIAWGNLWAYTDVMLFSLAALYAAIYAGHKWTGVLFTCLLAALASINLAAGCLGALMVAVIILFRAAVARRITSRERVVSIVCLTLFLAADLTMNAGPRSTGFSEALDAMLKALAWPGVFIPGAGFLTLVPLTGLATAYLFSPAFRTRNIEYVLGAGGLLFLLSIATGAFRGDNQNMGMPSGRYTDIFIMVPLVCAVALCFLYCGTTGGYRLGWGIFTFVWLSLQVVGFSIHLLYRTLPFMAQENGEWLEPNRQVLFRDLIRGVPHPLAGPDQPWDAIDLDPDLLEVAKGHRPMPAMTLPMITGFSLLPGSQGNYTAEGYYPSYRPRPAQLYVGSYDGVNRNATDKWFLSGPFHPQADYITIDVIVDKKARFTNYRLGGLQLTLRDETTGQRTELLPQLAHAFPFIFRDWELVYAKVTPGHEYRIESRDASPDQWIAFGEPFESGKLTPFIVIVSQSGKLLCLCGLGFLMLALGLDRFKTLRPTP